MRQITKVMRSGDRVTDIGLFAVEMRLRKPLPKPRPYGL